MFHTGKLLFLPFKLLWLREEPHHITPFFFWEEVSRGILRYLCAFSTGVKFPCRVTMEACVLNLELLLSQDLGPNNFLKKFQQWNKLWFVLCISYLRKDSYLRQGREGLFPPSHSYMWQSGHTVNEKSPNQHTLTEWTLLLSSCMASLSTPVMNRSELYLHCFTVIFKLSVYLLSGIWPTVLHPKIPIIPISEISITLIMLYLQTAQGQFIGDCSFVLITRHCRDSQVNGVRKCPTPFFPLHYM